MGGCTSAPGAQVQYSSMAEMFHVEEDAPGPPVGTIDVSAPFREAGPNACLAAARAIGPLTKMEYQGYCALERDSLYGAAVAVPQVARSARWPRTLLGLSVRAYVLLLVSVLTQGLLLSFLSQATQVMAPFAGRMHLCDFGASLAGGRSEGRDCRGPGGTGLTPERLRSFDEWSTRKFVREALRELFPHRELDIAEKVDPGEYGMESYVCRLVCLFVFMLTVVDDLRAAVELVLLHAAVPSRDGAWLRCEVSDPALERLRRKAGQEALDLETVTFQVAGIPLRWKFANGVLVIAPRLCLWWWVVTAGFHLLMETSGILDLVLNTLALTFVLSIDNVVQATLGTVATKYIMQNLEFLPLFSTNADTQETDGQRYERYKREEISSRLPIIDMQLVFMLMPKRLLAVFLLIVIFLARYYAVNCYQDAEGTWVSKDMFMPTSVTGDLVAYLFQTPVESVGPAFWSMPNDGPPEG